MTTPQIQTTPATPEPPQLQVLPEPPSAQTSQSSSPPIHQSTNPIIQPLTRPRTRNGKIARLPYPERDMVNRMLRNNIPHTKIKGALDEHGITVTERNISNWKTRGGYVEWCAEQDRAVEARILQDNLLEHVRQQDANQLPEIGLQAAATHLSQFFLKPETQQLLATQPEKLASTISMVCRLSRHIHALQKYRDDSAKELGCKHNPLRIKNEIDRQVEITRNVYSSYIPPNAPIDPEIPHRNYQPRNYYTPIEPLH